jgi:catechol 2,3-dioxygenase-like lactoylglutathione lyase family enzyme
VIDHISLRVKDLPRAVGFYRAALAPIGYEVLMEYPGAAGLGAGGKPDFWLMRSDQELNPTHIAFVGDRTRIDAFHAAALSAGATDNGPPGLRADYHPHYYAAFIYDPEGNNVEVVCHEPPSPTGVSKTSRGRTAPRRPAKPAPKAAVAAKTAGKAAGKTGKIGKIGLKTGKIGLKIGKTAGKAGKAGPKTKKKTTATGSKPRR